MQDLHPDDFTYSWEPRPNDMRGFYALLIALGAVLVGVGVLTLVGAFIYQCLQ